MYLRRENPKTVSEDSSKKEENEAKSVSRDR